jgi:Fe-S cluster assembly protein SufD
MGSVATATDELEGYRAAYLGQAPPPAAWLRALKAEAFERFLRRGFPTTRDEEWKYTNVQPLARTAFVPAAPAPAPLARLRQLDFGGAFSGQEIVFLNGRFVPELSTLHPAQGVAIRRLSDVLAEGVVAGQVGVVDAVERRTAFADLNTALLAEGVYLEVAAGAVVPSPIHVLHVSSAPEAPGVSHPRTLLVLRSGAQATVVETYGGAKGEVYFTNAVTEVVLENGAGLTHVRLQRESDQAYHVGTLAVRQDRDSRYANHNVGVGGALSRLDIACLLDGEGCELALDGLFIAGGTQLIDTHTYIDHARPHGTSRELYKGIMDDQARGVFHGNVKVRRGAQKTDAHQTNKNLLLSRQALVQSTPQLEILADDVKCKHGSTTGQLDAAALFYLRSRGISEQAARSLLVWAFASDLVARIGIAPVRLSLEAFLNERLPSAPKEAVS